MSKTLILDPHPDDSLLSISGVLKNSDDKSIDMISFFDNGSTSEKLKEFYPSINSIADWQDLKADTRGIVIDWKAMKKSDKLPHKYHEDIQKVHLDIGRQQYLKEVIQDINFDDYEFIYTPIGLMHCDHYLLSNVLEDFMTAPVESKFRWYYEKPYTERKYTMSVIDSSCKELKVDNIYYKVTKILQDTNKLDIFVKVFPEQKYQIRWESDLKDIPEYYIEVGL